jgi:hypothetical protein
VADCKTTPDEASGNRTVQLKLNPDGREAIAYFRRLRRFAMALLVAFEGQGDDDDDAA